MNAPAATAAKRPKLELPADDDEDICIIEEINVRPPHVAGGNSQTVGPFQLSEGAPAENTQDSKVAEFRNKMLKYEAEASHLRTQLKREQEKAQNAGRDAEVLKRYLEQKCEDERKRANEAEAEATAAAHQKVATVEKKAKDLQKQCERLETKVTSKEADVDFRDKQLGNAAKDLNEAKKKATNAEQKAAEADAKTAAAEKEASNLKQKLDELKENNAAAKQKLIAKVKELVKRLGDSEGQPSSSTGGPLAEDPNEAKRRITHLENAITKLDADNKKLKKELTASKAKATRLDNARKKADKEKDDKIQRLEGEIEGLREKLRKEKNPETLLEARLETARLRQAITRFDGLADKIMVKCDHGGVTMQGNPSRPTLPKVVLEMKPSFFDEYDCRKEYLAQIDSSLLLKGFASQAEKEQCRILKKYGLSMRIDFKSANEKRYVLALTLAGMRELEWTFIENNEPYACIFEMNSFVLAQAAQKLSPVLLEFSNRGQPNAVVITDSEDRLGGDQREYLWRSLRGDAFHQNDFKAEFSSTTVDMHLRIFVDPKYLRRCVMASADVGSKMVEVSMSEETLRLRYGNEQFSLTYFIPTVKPAENGERCYSPIEFGTETFEI